MSDDNVQVNGGDSIPTSPGLRGAGASLQNDDVGGVVDPTGSSRRFAPQDDNGVDPTGSSRLADGQAQDDGSRDDGGSAGLDPAGSSRRPTLGGTPQDDSGVGVDEDFLAMGQGIAGAVSGDMDSIAQPITASLQNDNGDVGVDPTGSLPLRQAGSRLAQYQAQDDVSVGYGKEQEPVGSVEMGRIEEVGEHEMEPEVEGWIEKLERAEDVHLQQPVVHDDQVLVSDPGVIADDMVVLPLTEEELEKGLHLKVLHSARWLAEWCKKLVLQMGQRVKFRG